MHIASDFIRNMQTLMMNNMNSDSSGIRGSLKYAEPMSAHTSWRAGGKADRYFEPADLEDLCLFMSRLPEHEPLLWVGLGSNLLVRDGGFRGTVIAYSRGLAGLHVDTGGSVWVEAGVPCAKVARATSRSGLTGAEFLAGIPGTMGGALAMNAGAFGGETWTIVQRVQMINRHGEISARTPADFSISYRTVRGENEEWFVSVDLLLAQDHDGGAEQRIRELLNRRSETQPIGLPSCGSVFRNPPGDHAARLIEACGLKGTRIGGAVISDKHANFIINEGAAAAGDIEQLMQLARDRVSQKFNIELHPEVKVVGEPL